MDQAHEKPGFRRRWQFGLRFLLFVPVALGLFLGLLIRFGALAAVLLTLITTIILAYLTPRERAGRERLGFIAGAAAGLALAWVSSPYCWNGFFLAVRARLADALFLDLPAAVRFESIVIRSGPEGFYDSPLLDVPSGALLFGIAGLAVSLIRCEGGILRHTLLWIIAGSITGTFFGPIAVLLGDYHGSEAVILAGILTGGCMGMLLAPLVAQTAARARGPDPVRSEEVGGRSLRTGPEVSDV